MGHIDEFIAARREANRAVVGEDHLGIKRFFALDEAAYRDGALRMSVVRDALLAAASRCAARP